MPTNGYSLVKGKSMEHTGIARWRSIYEIDNRLLDDHIVRLGSVLEMQRLNDSLDNLWFTSLWSPHPEGACPSQTGFLPGSNRLARQHQAASRFRVMRMIGVDRRRKTLARATGRGINSALGCVAGCLARNSDVGRTPDRTQGHSRLEHSECANRFQYSHRRHQFIRFCPVLVSSNW